MAIISRDKSTIYGLNADLAALNQADIDEKALREAQGSNLQDQIDVLDTDLGTKTSLFTQDKTNLVAAINELHTDALLGSQAAGDDLTAETNARIAADGVLQDNIDSEEAARIAADNTLQSNIDTEEAARISADNTLQANIDVETARIDAILSASTADADSFAEIVSLINSVDTENDDAFASYVLSNNAAVAQNESDIADNAQAIISGDAATLASAQSYADQAEADAISSSNSYTDAEISSLDASLKSYADTAEADAISSSNSYTDGREVAITAAYTSAIADVTVKAKTETLTVSGDSVTLSNSALNNVLLNFSTVRHTDSGTGVSYDIPSTVNGTAVTLFPDVASQFDGKSIVVQYFYI